MFSFGKGKSAPAGGAAGGAGGGDGVIYDVTDATFMAKVVEASRERPVLVDFWATWCGPCRQLGPALEQVVRDSGGKVALAKMDIDRNPMVAGQLGIRSIPAVYAFVDGQPIDGFTGALPPSQLKQFVDQVLKASAAAGMGPAADIEALLEAAEQALEQSAVGDAAQAFAAVLRIEPTELRAIAGLARCYAKSGDLARAKQALSMAPADKASDPAIAAARGQIELAEQAAGAVAEVAKNRARLEANANDHQARFDLALALAASGDRGGAVDELLDIFRRDRTWSEEAAKKQLMKLFETFGPKDPVTLSGRRRLSSMIFS